MDNKFSDDLANIIENNNPINNSEENIFEEIYRWQYYYPFLDLFNLALRDKAKVEKIIKKMIFSNWKEEYPISIRSN